MPFLQIPTDFSTGRRAGGRAWRPLVQAGPWLLACALALGAPCRAAEEADAQTAAVATGSGPLETTIVVETLQVEEGPGGKEIRRWAPADRLTAGEEIHYTVRVTNPGKQPVSEIVVTKRLPYGVHYLPGTATGPGCEVQFSTDGGNTFAKPERSSGGSKKGTRKSPTVEYTHVRWILGNSLDPGATALLRFRAKFF
jgi:uncharacterized repeat protein (TIGR01451 family)